MIVFFTVATACEYGAFATPARRQFLRHCSPRFPLGTWTAMHGSGRPLLMGELNLQDKVQYLSQNRKGGNIKDYG